MTYFDEGHSWGGTVLLDLLYVGDAIAVVGNGQAEEALTLGHLDVLAGALPMYVDGVLQANLSAEDAVHVHLLRVQGAVHYLQE